MLTFPRSLGTFRKIVNQRGDQLRKLPFENLKRLTAEHPEHLTVESRPATISIIVQPQPNGGLRVVIQGFMDTRFLKLGKHVALDGFYKYPDGSTAEMPNEEFYEFD
jgi:hypothetical protein